ncbi:MULTISPECIES: xanthine dehydrogenase molybdopterin binding subunit [unclassified Arthrobacter]|uniref:xanthine dehydrogenase molybdopterin binding subunit n=1 Tax=unclassified Arthrobacter TaxID=235627 RepID=UPI0014922421|nr:xanthine dehydrogenase molybdopterin binding subunit [Arthrobacter sp. AET 35A]MBE0009986.1 xanthine dehydrogenase molybdopterin binding subunit [Arthrobacter sp. AET 35A]NOJ63841.1 xanthine dehydrogenase molybdopterin binding subunit [Arthrobacter sp. 147(2020)]
MKSLANRPINPVVGQPVSHESADQHVTGEALYTDDLVVRSANVLHAWPVQAPHAHALVESLGTDAALTVPGVVRVLTAADVPGINDAGIKHDEPLFPTEVMFHGHAVCWVLGETLEAARLGAEAVQVHYRPLPSLLTLTEAIEAESFQGNQPTLSRGEADAALDAAAHRFSGDIEFGGQEHFYLETHASFVYVDEGGQVFVHCSTQHPSETQEIVAHVLGLQSHEVTVQCLRMGGGFGGKEMQPHGYAAIAALGATLTGRPVRLRLNRTQDITLSGKRHPFHARWEVGFDEEGRIQALKATLTSDGGWSLDLSEPVLARALCHIDNAYWIPNVEVHGRVAKTNKTSQTAFRGFGGPQGMFVIEDILGRCAPLLGVDPGELRRRNLYVPGQTTPYGQPVRHAERLQAIWRQLHDSADVVRRQEEIREFNATHPHLRRALAVTPVKFGISFNLTAFNQAGALVHVYKDGSILINHGGTEMGQGLHTKMRQVAATALGVPLGLVRLAPTRTDKVPNTSATAASSGADLNGGAVKDACEQIRDRLAEVAARKLNIHPEDVRFVNGVVTGIGFTDREIGFAELARDAYFQRVSLSAAGYYRTEGLHWDISRMQGEPFKYFSYGAAASEVEVDGFTGAYRQVRTDIVHDVGDSLSPLIDVGQIEGGFVQGAGWLTLEDLRWDTSDGPQRGRLATQSASTYKLPSFSEMPEEFTVHLFERATEDGVVYGSKAVGEPPLMLAFSVREALRLAAAAFGPGDREVQLASPATPEAVFWALTEAREAQTARDRRTASTQAGPASLPTPEPAHQGGI